MIPHTLEGEKLRRQCRRDYGVYVTLANPGFVMTHFHRYLCDQIQEFLEMRTDNAMDILLLSVPPRHGKTFTVTETLPSWYLGKNPDANVILCSYEGTFAESFSRRNRDKFNEVACDVFNTSDHPCSPNKNVQGVALWETEQEGRCRAAGLKAGITGFGADLFIIDDPIKNQEAADSETIIAKIHAEMGPSVQSRVHPHGKLIVIQTRWVENDVVGYIQTHWGDYVWKDINLPCECEDPEHDPLGRSLGDSLMGEHLGDPLLPERIRNDNGWLHSKKQLVLAGEGERTWNALYQGHPSSANGNLFHAGSWRTFDRTQVPYEQCEYTCLSIDATFKKTETSDMVGITLWGLYHNNAYLYGLVNKRMGFIETVDKIRAIVARWGNIDELIIEDKANGSAIIDVLKYDKTMPPIVGVNPLGGKYSRAQAVSPFVEGGNVHIATDWTAEERRDVEWDGKEHLEPHQYFITQHAHFPFAKHDDMVDSCTQALSRLIKLLTGEEPRPDHKVTRFVKWYPDMWEDYYSMTPLQQQEFIRTYGAPLEWEEY